MTTTTLADVIDALTKEGELYERLPKNKLRCFACGHRCVIFDGQRGICKVRFNRDGVLKVPTRYVGALQCDPTEKKPFYHLLPGSNTLTFGMLGCDFHCSYCQNWLTSQTIRDPAAVVPPKEISAGTAGAACGRPWCARNRQLLQRAPDHRRVVGRGVQAG